MGRKTVYVKRNLEPGNYVFCQEPPYTALTGWPYHDQPAPIAIMNNKGSGVKISIEQLNCRPITGPQALTSSINLVKISAVTTTGSIPLVPLKFNSSNADLPSQFISVFEPYSITEAGTIKKSMLFSSLNFTNALSVLVSAANGDCSKSLDSGEFCQWIGDSDIQKIVLNQGEGVALVMAANSPCFCFSVSFSIRNTTTGECYRYNDLIESRFMSGKPIMAFFNGSGTGYTYELLRVQIREIGTTELPVIEYCLIEGINDADTCEDAVYVMADSTCSIPSGVLLKKDCVTKKLGYRSGAIMTMPQLRRVQLGEPPWGPGVAGGLQIARIGKFAPDLALIKEDSEIILPEGMGIALYVRNASAATFHEFTANITIEENDTKLFNASPIGGRHIIKSRD